jgi:hypothetical protein
MEVVCSSEISINLHREVTRSQVGGRLREARWAGGYVKPGGQEVTRSQVGGRLREARWAGGYAKPGGQEVTEAPDKTTERLSWR